MSLPCPEDDIARIRSTPLFDADWYLRHYPDVARLPLEPAAHFALIGAPLGRNPGPNFSTRYYLATNPDVAAAGLNPLLHYLTIGKTEGRKPHPGAVPSLPRPVQAQLTHLRHLLETGGLDDGPRQALEALAARQDNPETAMGAAEALAIWALHQENPSEARRWLNIRLQLGPGAAARLAPLQVIATARDRDQPAAKALAASAPGSIELDLARGWTETSDEGRLACLNGALTRAGLAPVSLAGGPEALFDRLTSPAPTRPADDTMPLVSILMAAHNSADTIATALRAIQAQSWPRFELLVIDDASTDDTARIVSAAAGHDPRIRLIPLQHNTGAYGARNIGLAQAKGRFITLHDADDWSHPERLARQVTFLLENPGYAGCLSQQARCTPDLRVSRWTGTGALVFENMTSLMLPTDLIRNCLGSWDELRVSADSELLRRVRRLFGEHSVATLGPGPLALIRDSRGSATADSATGMDWFYYGARREYYEAQLHHHATARHLFYPPGGSRPFPAPDILQIQTGARQEIRLDRVYAGRMTDLDQGLKTLLCWLEEDQAKARRTGLVPLYTTDMPVGGGLSIHPRLRALIDGTNLRVLCYGERAHCTHYRLLPRQTLPEAQRYLPEVHEGGRLVLAPGQAPAATVLPAHG